MSTTCNLSLSVPFFLVDDMEISLPFYVLQLGFTISKRWTPRGKIEWCWLQRDVVSLMLQEARNSGKSDQEAAKGVGISICYQCVDALALYHEFIAKGVVMAEPFVGNNMWVVNLADPDGYRLSFESPTEVPEETKYSDWHQ